MLKTLKYLLYFFLFLILSAGLLLIIGGGYGKKEPGRISYDRSLLLFAHRGIRNYYPENSGPSFSAAARLGFRAVEMDVRKTGDGVYVIFHDDTLGRLLGIPGRLDTTPLAVLKKHPFVFRGKPTEAFVLTLDEMLSAYRDTFRFYIDMKMTECKDADAIARVIRKYGIADRCCVATADARFILYLEYRYPEINTALEGFNPGKEWMYPALPKRFRPDYLSGFLQPVTPDQIRWLKKKGLLKQRIVYGVEKDNLDRALEFGIPNLIIDYDSSLHSRLFPGK